jgi:hypothetical protein
MTDKDKLETVATFLREFWSDRLRDFMSRAVIDPAERGAHEPFTATFGPEHSEYIMRERNIFWTIMTDSQREPFLQAAEQLLSEID